MGKHRNLIQQDTLIICYHSTAHEHNKYNTNIWTTHYPL